MKNENEKIPFYTDSILYINFNQDASFFCIGTKQGFSIFRTYPIKELYREIIDGGVQIIEMYKRTNLLGLVGTGQNQKFKKNNLVIWDCERKKKNSEILLDRPILKLKIKENKIIISTEGNKLYIFDFPNLKVIKVYKTYEGDDKGLFAISLNDNISVLAFPYMQVGYIKIKNFDSKKNVPTINAHDNSIAQMTINNEGNLLASASEKGTLIRIFCTLNGDFIQELRRGVSISNIYYLIFDENNKFLGCSSSSGTIHIFSLYNSNKYLREKGIIAIKTNNTNSSMNCSKNEEQKNQKGFFGTILSALKIGITFFEAEWSFLQFRIPKTSYEVIVNFISSSYSIIVISKNGTIYQASFDPSLGGECHKIDEITLGE